MTDAAEQAEWDSDNGSYLAGLKGVTIPGTAPSLNESHKRGRHGSSEDALRANASDMMGIFESLNGKPAVQMTVESIVPAKPAPKAEGDDAENAENTDNANQTARGNEDEHRKANGATAASPAAAQHQPTPRQSAPSQVDATAHGDGNKRHTKPWFSKPAPSTPVQRPAPFSEAQKPSMTPVEDYYTMPENTFEEQQDEPLTARMPELDPEFTRDTDTTPKIPLNSIPSPLPVTDFVVPETTGSDKDAIPPQRLEKARLVEETLRAEHPDADDEFVAAIRQLVELNASDLHLVINDPPMLRVDGKLQPAKDLSVWNKDHTFAAVQTMTNDLELERFKDDLELDISFSIGDLLRFRVNVYRDRLGICAALLHRRPATLPRKCIPRPPGHLRRTAHHPHRNQNREAARPRPAHRRPGAAAARPGARMRPDRLRQVHHAGRHRRQGERGTRRPHHHHRRPDRIRTPAQALRNEPARSGHRHEKLRRSAEASAARRP